MTAVNRNDMNANVLQTWLERKTLENLRAELFFFRFGQKPKVASGYNTVSWARFDKLAASSVTTGTTSDDGQTPTDTAFNATVITATPIQYRIVITLSDVVIENNVISFLSGAAEEVGKAMAEKIDAVIQTEAMAGTNVIYAGTSNSARTDLEITDVLTAGNILRASDFLHGKSARKFGNFYVGIIHSFQAYDLKIATAAGSWLEVSKYTTPDKIFKGEIGAMGGVRIMVSAYVQTFSSTATVYPALFLGQGAYGVSQFENLQVMMTSGVPSDSDPLAQRRKVGAKVMFVPKRLQEDAMVRVETGATLLFS